MRAQPCAAIRSDQEARRAGASSRPSTLIGPAARAILAPGTDPSRDPLDILSHLNSALVGRYAVEREVGAGGMATVYFARDARHGRGVALKLLKPELGAVLGAERFLAEITTTANLQHPHILPLFDSGEPPWHATDSCST